MNTFGEAKSDELLQSILFEGDSNMFFEESANFTEDELLWLTDKHFNTSPALQNIPSLLECGNGRMEKTHIQNLLHCESTQQQVTISHATIEQNATNKNISRYDEESRPHEMKKTFKRIGIIDIPEDISSVELGEIEDLLREFEHQYISSSESNISTRGNAAYAIPDNLLDAPPFNPEQNATNKNNSRYDEECRPHEMKKTFKRIGIIDIPEDMSSVELGEIEDLLREFQHQYISSSESNISTRGNAAYAIPDNLLDATQFNQEKTVADAPENQCEWLDSMIENTSFKSEKNLTDIFEEINSIQIGEANDVEIIQEQNISNPDNEWQRLPDENLKTSSEHAKIPSATNQNDYSQQEYSKSSTEMMTGSLKITKHKRAQHVERVTKAELVYTNDGRMDAALVQKLPCRLKALPLTSQQHGSKRRKLTVGSDTSCHQQAPTYYLLMYQNVLFKSIPHVVGGLQPINFTGNKLELPTNENSNTSSGLAIQSSTSSTQSNSRHQGAAIKGSSQEQSIFSTVNKWQRQSEHAKIPSGNNKNKSSQQVSSKSSTEMMTRALKVTENQHAQHVKRVTNNPLSVGSDNGRRNAAHVQKQLYRENAHASTSQQHESSVIQKKEKTRSKRAKLTVGSGTSCNQPDKSSYYVIMDQNVSDKSISHVEGGLQPKSGLNSNSNSINFIYNKLEFSTNGNFNRSSGRDIQTATNSTQSIFCHQEAAGMNSNENDDTSQVQTVGCNKLQ